MSVSPCKANDFLDSMLDAVKVQNSAKTIKIVGQGMLKCSHQMMFTDEDLLQALISKVSGWLPTIMSTDDMRGHTFLSKACASIAYLAVGTGKLANIDKVRKLLNTWEKQLRATGNKLDRNLADDLVTYIKAILDNKSTDWILVTG
jgi:hypothetical protein